jgi:hypothetical protein
MRTVLASVVVLCASLAQGAPKRVALHQIKVTGNASDEERKLLDERIWMAVELLASDRGYDLVHREDFIAAQHENPDVKHCDEPRCNLKLGDFLGAERLIVVRVARSGPPGRGDWQMRIEQLAVPTAIALPPVEMSCPLCTADKVVGDLTKALEPLLATKPPPPLCTLELTSEPAGADVEVNGMVLGQTPFTHTFAPGHHEVAMSRTGSLPGHSSVECTQGQSQHVSVTLLPTPAAAPVAERPPSRSPALKIVGATLLVLGVAGVAAGAAELAVDGQPSCKLPAGQRQCPQLYDTGTTGAALTAVGALAIAGGVATLVVDALRKPKLRAALSPLPGGALLTIGAER